MTTLYSSTAGSAITGTPPIKGTGIAHRKASPYMRALLAASCVLGHRPFRPSITQAASIFGVTVVRVREAIREQAFFSGLSVEALKAAANGNGNGHANESLAQHITRCSSAERQEAARTVGVDLIWDEMISPIVAADRAAVE